MQGEFLGAALLVFGATLAACNFILGVEARPERAAPDVVAADGGGGIATASSGGATGTAGMGGVPTCLEVGAGPAARKRVFVTKAGHSGAFVGATGGDLECTEAAADAGLGSGGWRAWLSETAIPASTHVGDAAPWYLVDRETLVFADQAQLKDVPDHAIDMNEDGECDLDVPVWTGTQPGGDPSGDNCADWTANGNVIGTYGSSASTDEAWTQHQTLQCFSQARLYCFEQ